MLLLMISKKLKRAVLENKLPMKIMYSILGTLKEIKKLWIV